ncbi:hypothetical protein [Anoxybacter fermentans]|nr:hypothetical protein [Anoxybacter fermentans]
MKYKRTIKKNFLKINFFDLQYSYFVVFSIIYQKFNILNGSFNIIEELYY